MHAQSSCHSSIAYVYLYMYACTYVCVFVLQIACASSSSKLADRTRFRAYFQMVPTEVDLTAGFAAIARQYGWRHMSIIQQQENLFSTVRMQRKATVRVSSNLPYSCPPSYVLTIVCADCPAIERAISSGQHQLECPSLWERPRSGVHSGWALCKWPQCDRVFVMGNLGR